MMIAVVTDDDDDSVDELPQNYGRHPLRYLKSMKECRMGRRLWNSGGFSSLIVATEQSQWLKQRMNKDGGSSGGR